MDHTLKYKYTNAVSSSVSSYSARIISAVFSTGLNSDFGRLYFKSQSKEFLSSLQHFTHENTEDVLEASVTTKMPLGILRPETEQPDFENMESISSSRSTTSLVSYVSANSHISPALFGYTYSLDSSPYLTYSTHVLIPSSHCDCKLSHFCWYSRRLQQNCQRLLAEVVEGKELVTLNKCNNFHKLSMQSIWTGLCQFLNITRFLQIAFAWYSFLLSRITNFVMSSSKTDDQVVSDDRLESVDNRLLCNSQPNLNDTSGRTQHECLMTSKGFGNSQQETETAQNQESYDIKDNSTNLSCSLVALLAENCSSIITSKTFDQFSNPSLLSETSLLSYPTIDFVTDNELDDTADSAIDTMLSTTSVNSCITSLNSLESHEGRASVTGRLAAVCHKLESISPSSFFISPSEVDSDDTVSEFDSENEDWSATDTDDNTDLCLSDPIFMSGIILSQLTDDGSSSGGSRSNSFSLLESDVCFELDNREDVADNSDDEIIFCNDSAGDDVTDSAMTDSLLQINSRWDSHYGSVPVVLFNNQEYVKVVHFAVDSDLITVHEEPCAEAGDYFEARRGPWEEYARDRDRFQKRIKDAETVLSSVLQSSHRQKVYSKLCSAAVNMS